MRASVYISKENEKLLKELMSHKDFKLNSLINEALTDYLTTEVVDDNNFRKLKDYSLVKIRLHNKFIEVLKAMKRSFSAFAVAEFLTHWACVELKRQQGRGKFPDRVRLGQVYYKKEIEDVHEKLKKWEKWEKTKGG